VEDWAAQSADGEPREPDHDWADLEFTDCHTPDHCAGYAQGKLVRNVFASLWSSAPRRKIFMSAFKPALDDCLQEASQGRE
jgi:hypothetical protein